MFSTRNNQLHVGIKGLGNDALPTSSSPSMPLTLRVTLVNAIKLNRRNLSKSLESFYRWIYMCIHIIPLSRLFEILI